MNIPEVTKRFGAMLFLLALVLTATAQVDKSPTPNGAKKRQ